MIVKELNIGDSDEVISKKLNDDKEIKMKKYFILGLRSLVIEKWEKDDIGVSAVLSLHDEFGWEAEWYH